MFIILSSTNLKQDCQSVMIHRIRMLVPYLGRFSIWNDIESYWKVLGWFEHLWHPIEPWASGWWSFWNLNNQFEFILKWTLIRPAVLFINFFLPGNSTFIGRKTFSVELISIVHRSIFFPNCSQEITGATFESIKDSCDPFIFRVLTLYFHTYILVHT